MSNSNIPTYQGEVILDHTPRKAFQIDTESIISSIKQQFSHRSLCFRELGQNSVDSGCSMIESEFRYDAENKLMLVFFRDDGCGMDEKIIKSNYLCLFDSSKENIIDKIGEFSLGRLSMLCYDLAGLEIITMTPQGGAYAVVIHPTLSGKVFEISRLNATKMIGTQHGTLVCMKIPLPNKEAFVEEVKIINETIRKELCWINPAMHQTTVKLQKNGELNYKREKINITFEVPGEYTMQDKHGNSHFDVKLASGLGEVTLSVGLENTGSKNLPSITLCKGNIPIERPNGLPWTGGEAFTLQKTHVILDSFYFKTNIGRNRISLDTPFLKELLPKIFKHVILEGFVRSSAILLTKNPLEIYEHRTNFQILMADTMVQSEKHNFSPPVEVLNAPFIPSYTSHIPYSLDFLDKWEGSIYFTWERPSSMSMRNFVKADEPEFICICLADLPYQFQDYLEKRYNGRLVKKENRLLVNNFDTPKALKISELVEKKLELKSVWSNFRNSVENSKNFPDHLAVRVGNFYSYKGTEEKMTPTYFQNNPFPTVYLNLNNTHIQNLIDLLSNSNKYQMFAAHFLIREILCDIGFSCPANQRENLLTKDIVQRFGRANLVRLPWEEENISTDCDLNEFIQIFDNVINL